MGREAGDRAGHFCRSSVPMRKTVAPEAPWVSLGIPNLVWNTDILSCCDSVYQQEGRNLLYSGERSGKKSVNRNSGAKKLGSETIDGKGGGMGSEL